MSQSVNTIISNDTLKAANSNKRQITELVQALWLFLDSSELATKAQKDRAMRASASIGRKQLANKNALTRDPSQLRMHVEAIKQKTEAIKAKLPTEKGSFAENFNCANAIRVAIGATLENVDIFLKEYNEHKQTVQANKAA